MPICTVCRKEIDVTDTENGETREHVIPFSWYPDSTPTNVQRWTVPSHKKCNASYSLDEQYVFEKLATTVPPDLNAAKGIWDRVYRGLNPAAGKNEKSSNARRRARTRILNSFVPTDEITSEMIRHGFKSITNDSPAPELLLLDAERLGRVITKITDCAYYYLTGSPPTGVYDYRFNIVGLEQFAHAWTERGEHLNWARLGPGVAIGNAITSDTTGSGALIQVLLWDSIMFEGIYVWHKS